MIYFKWFFIFLGTCISVLSMLTTAYAAPVIGIGSMYDVLTPDMQSMTKRIYNTGDSTAFVRVDILKVNPDGRKGTDEVPQKELSGTILERDRLIVTPLRLIIPPTGFQTVRILWPGKREKEKYYRVRFIPVMPQTGDSFGLDKNEISEYRKKNFYAGLNVLTGYGTIVIVQPEKPQFNTAIIDEADPSGITVENNGNTTLILDNIRQCRSDDSDCGAISRKFILPGQRYVVKKNGYKTNFTLIEGNSKQTMSY